MTEKKGGFLNAIKEFIYGMAAHDSARFALKTRANMEHLFMLVTMGDLVGVPLLAPLLFPASAALRGAPDRHLEAPHAQGEGPDRRPGVVPGGTGVPPVL